MTARSEPLEEDNAYEEMADNTVSTGDGQTQDPHSQAKDRNGLYRSVTPQNQPRFSQAGSADPNLSPGSISNRGPQTSTTSLIAAHPETEALQQVDSSSSSVVSNAAERLPLGWTKSKIHRVRFDHPKLRPRTAEVRLRANIAQTRRHQRLPRVLTSRSVNDGQIVKMDKMLVRQDLTSGYERPQGDFDEKSSRSIETRVIKKWREFMVVCRETRNPESPFTLQFYDTRVIPTVNNGKAKRSRQRFKREVMLNHTLVKVNLYSSLDKTIVLWTPRRARTQFFYLRPKSGTLAVEWYHFLRELLGLKRDPTIQVNIPALSVNVRLYDPFRALVDSAELAMAADGDEEALVRVEASERRVTGSIIDRCLKMLYGHPEWSTVLDEWANKYQLGLAWKRYDRIEWLHGGHERNMYGAMAMLKSHDLELRVKQHYPTVVKTAGDELLQEPTPIEGFLIRLTSPVGAHKRIGMGALFYKRLYFTSQDQYLIFLRPAKAVPPKPPKIPAHRPGADCVPTTQQIKNDTPLTYAVDPYQMQDDNIIWLNDATTAHEAAQHDAAAADEALRNAQALLNCDGFVNLCDCIQIRNIRRGTHPVDEDLESGSEVDFDQTVPDSHRDDGVTTQLDDDRTFEMVLRSGLVIRLQAYSKAMKLEWITGLRKLVRYWTLRHAADIELYKSIRKRNVQALNIDERTEAYVGQYAEKWEVSNSHASAELYHVCGIAACRAIHVSGQLYRKPRMHALFSRCQVIVAHGHLIIFRDVSRSGTGKKLNHIHHDKIDSIDLADCYCYSGLITESDLLYQNRTFDSTAPGSHSLPRVFLDDRWTSNDDDSMTTFVIWHGRRKGWFRTADAEAGDEGRVRTRFKKVNQLGVKGRSIVFKARSRAERDHWVMAINVEIERLTRIGDASKTYSDDVRLDT